MTDYQFIKTLPKKENFSLFNDVVSRLYKKDSPRFVSGNEPSPLFLEGCYVLLRNNLPVGRFAFYENPNLQYKNSSACCIGSYECEKDIKTSGILIQHAQQIAISKNYSWLLGPMEGSTWNNYRFSLRSNPSLMFMEPYHHLYYNDQFTKAGFQCIHNYVSTAISSEYTDSQLLSDIEAHNAKNGFTIRNIELSNYENELKKIAHLSFEGFNTNFLYTPIDEQDFLSKYLPLKPYIDPSLVWMIEDKNKVLHGYVFGIKDYHDISNDTLIIKTIVRKKESKLHKLGLYFLLKINSVAKQNGYRKVVHAFMSKENFSSKESGRNNSNPIQEYALYGMKL